MNKSTGHALTIFLGVILLLIGAWSIIQMLSQPIHLSSIPDEELEGLKSRMLLRVAAGIGLLLCGFVLVIRGIIKIMKSQKNN